MQLQVLKCLPSKHEALGSNSSTKKKKKSSETKEPVIIDLNQL
jgi:hypothetical protein